MGQARRILQVLRARGESRTPTPLREPGPEPGASTIPATRAGLRITAWTAVFSLWSPVIGADARSAVILERTTGLEPAAFILAR